MRKLGIILILVTEIALLYGILWPFETRLSQKDVAFIIMQVRQYTGEPIISISAEPRWRVRILTGENNGSLSGGGQEFHLHQNWGGWGKWRIQKKLIWIG